MIATEFHERLQAAVGDRTYRHIGELTKTHPETVRRYMQGQLPATDFLAALCEALSISGDWILTGRGPMKVEEQRAQSLREAGPGDLLAAIASNLEKLYERVDRLERYTQVLEVRLRAVDRPPDATASPRQAEPPPPPEPQEPPPVEIHVQVRSNAQSKPHPATNGHPIEARRARANGEAAEHGHGTSDGQAAAAATPERVRRVQRALAQRSRPDAR